MTKAYITKYALTEGVYEVCGDLSEFTGGLFVEKILGVYPQYHGRGDWHLTPEAAIAKAEEMRIKKLQSLDKQMKKLSALKFEIK